MVSPRHEPGLFEKISHNILQSEHFLMHLDTGAKKLMGQTGAYKNRKNHRSENFEFYMGTPLPLETSAVLSQIGDEEKRDES